VTQYGEPYPCVASKKTFNPRYGFFEIRFWGIDVDHGLRQGATPYDKHPSFAVNLNTGLWLCRAQSCKAKGNVKHFCDRLKLSLPPAAKVQRFPRLRTVGPDDEWQSAQVFQEAFDYLTRQIHFTHSWQPVVVTLWAMGTYLHMQFSCYGHHVAEFTDDTFGKIRTP
jgi:hypothetical protein